MLLPTKNIRTNVLNTLNNNVKTLLLSKNATIYSQDNKKIGFELNTNFGRLRLTLYNEKMKVYFIMFSFADITNHNIHNVWIKENNKQITIGTYKELNVFRFNFNNIDNVVIDLEYYLNLIIN